MSSSGSKKEEKDEVVIKVGVHDSLTSIKRNNNIIIKVNGFVPLLYFSIMVFVLVMCKSWAHFEKNFSYDFSFKLDKIVSLVFCRIYQVAELHLNPH